MSLYELVSFVHAVCYVCTYACKCQAETLKYSLLCNVLLFLALCCVGIYIRRYEVHHNRYLLVLFPTDFSPSR